MKYIVLKTGGRECPVLFPSDFSHRYLADLFAPAPVVAAGFVHEGPDGISCGGESAGLRIGSRGGVDVALIRGALGEE
ncbi:hypothetical protein [uncultured Thiodictyon sp.]|uniref:hypothetical protein n=1 Tax=uncultured Thiodictyon sp. TaxID=1846217 RepID=UPI0025FD9565|nr:hypothetical protein [uncultured Thiodictyon sp.]